MLGNFSDKTLATNEQTLLKQNEDEASAVTNRQPKATSRETATNGQRKGHPASGHQEIDKPQLPPREGSLVC
jgi:hypothetical protein